MEPGELRHKVTIQRRVQLEDGRGGPVDSYEDWLIDIWAEVLHLEPRELWQAQQVNAEITMKVRLRYRPGLDAQCRVRWQRLPGSPTQLQYLEVAGPPIEVKGRRDEVWLMCIAREADGFRTGDTDG